MPFEDNYHQSRSVVDFAGLSAPSVGENILWDYSNLSITDKFTVYPYLEFIDSEFPLADLSNQFDRDYNIATEDRTGHHIYGSFLDGFFYYGARFNSAFTIPVFGGAGSIKYLEEDVIASQSIKMIPTPATFGTKEEVSYTETNNFLATYPPAGLNNTPGATVDSLDYSIEVVAWGQLKLPTYSETFDVLLFKRSYISRQYQFLGGAPAPASLLANLGIEDGYQSTSTTYVFYAKGHGPIAFVRYRNGELTRASFVNDLPR